MLKCKCYHFHNWKYVKDSYKEKFLGEECERYYNRFRICSKCGKAQFRELLFGYKDTGWIDLNEYKTKILKSKIEPAVENDKIV